MEIFFSAITAKWKKANQQEKDDLPVWVSLHGNKLLFLANDEFEEHCRNHLHCFITKLISNIRHCVLFDIFLFNQFDDVCFFCNNILISF